MTTEYTAVNALADWMAEYARQVSDCVSAGECVHDHMPDVCGLTDDERATS